MQGRRSGVKSIKSQNTRHTLNELFGSYELLVDRADAAFQEMQKSHRAFIKCERHCSDCCHAVFGLFIIEAAYLKAHFDRLGAEDRKAALLRRGETERALKRLEIKLQKHEDDPRAQSYIMASERVPCPLLSGEQECILYAQRPITCRVYGMPTMIHGKTRACGKCLFKKGESYPVFNLDDTYRDLYGLSREFLETAERGDPAKGDLLISVSRAISTSLDDLLCESFE